MGGFGRMERLVGTGLDQLDEPALMKLVAGRVREDDDLDFKLELYGRGDSDKRSLAGDVAAMANGRGGVIVLGIEELDATAVAAPGVELSDAEELRMQQAVASHTAPHVAFNVRRVPSAADERRGFYLLEVPPSRWAPHAVRVNDALRYPKRAGTSIRWLSESEVADAYRNRFAGARQQVERAATVRQEGEADIDVGSSSSTTWLSMALVPDSPGDMELSRRRIEELEELTQQLPGPVLHVSPLRGEARARAGHRRAVIELREWPPATAHLHTDGSGFAAAPVGKLSRERLDDSLMPDVLDESRIAEVPDELLTQSVIDALGLLALHASDSCGVRGAALVETTLVYRSPMALVGTGDYDARHWSPKPIVTAPVGRHTIDIDDVLASVPGRLIAARLVVTDLVQGFGLAESPQITADGELRRKHWAPDVHPRIASEASRLGIGVTEDTID